MIPYGRQDISEADIQAVIDVLKSDWLTQGPAIGRFEDAVAARVDAAYAVATCNATAALHVACLALGVRRGDLVWTVPNTFVASANCILFVGATPRFVDIDTKTMNLDVERLEAAITPRTKAIVAVEAFGHPGGMLETEAIARRNELTMIEDSCEGFGGGVGATGSPTTLSRGANVRTIGSFGRASVCSDGSPPPVPVAGACENSRITKAEAATARPRNADSSRVLRFSFVHSLV